MSGIASGLVTHINNHAHEVLHEHSQGHESRRGHSARHAVETFSPPPDGEGGAAVVPPKPRAVGPSN